MYRLLEEKLKSMMTVLPLVSDLHHPAMRERHWHMLMKVGAGGAWRLLWAARQRLLAELPLLLLCGGAGLVCRLQGHARSLWHL